MQLLFSVLSRFTARSTGLTRSLYESGHKKNHCETAYFDGVLFLNDNMPTCILDGRSRFRTTRCRRAARVVGSRADRAAGRAERGPAAQSRSAGVDRIPLLRTRRRDPAADPCSGRRTPRRRHRRRGPEYSPTRPAHMTLRNWFRAVRGGSLRDRGRAARGGGHRR